MDAAGGELSGAGAWPAPAKLNRFLHVTGRREDGYHLLQTAFQFLDRHDLLWFEPTTDGRVQLADPLPGLAAADDLALRAAILLRAHSGVVTAGVRIRRRKRLPAGAGLGGGSSNAATTLVALNHLWSLGFDVDRLAALGLRLGADVPVFVRGRAAWGEGVGERLTPLALDRPWFAVLLANVTVPTAAVFADPELPRTTPRRPPGVDFQTCANDCEAVVYRRYPAVAAAAKLLGAHGRARLSGTGSAVFAAFPTKADAERALRAALAAAAAEFRGFVSRGHNDSMLQDRLQQATIARDSQSAGP